MAEKKDALAKTQTSELAIPDFMKDSMGAGFENMERNEVTLPRLALAQAISHQLDSTSPKYIEDLKQGEMFNDLTGKIYGKDKLKIVVVRKYPRRAIEFYSRDAGGGIKDMNVPLNDPRCSFGPNGERPPATVFADYAVILPDFEGELLAWSLKSSSLKVASNLNGLAVARKGGLPLFSMVFTIVPVSQKGAKGTYFTYKVDNSGDLRGDEKTYTLAKKYFEQLKDSTLKPTVDLDPDAEGAERESSM